MLYLSLRSLCLLPVKPVGQKGQGQGEEISRWLAERVKASLENETKYNLFAGNISEKKYSAADNNRLVFGLPPVRFAHYDHH